MPRGGGQQEIHRGRGPAPTGESRKQEGSRECLTEYDKQAAANELRSQPNAISIRQILGPLREQSSINVA